jgi:hypothetical protein
MNCSFRWGLTNLIQLWDNAKAFAATLAEASCLTSCVSGFGADLQVYPSFTTNAIGRLR